MTAFEKKISFLNRYFIYKKVREFNLETVQLDLGEYEDTAEKRQTVHAVEVAKEEIKKTAPKVRKLSKKLLLVAATEAVDEPALVIEKAMEKKKKTEKPKKSKKPITIIEEDDEVEEEVKVVSEIDIKKEKRRKKA